MRGKEQIGERLVSKDFKIIFDLLRVKQWVKNAFIFFPLFFSGQFFLRDLLENALLTFTGFCFVSSGLYILNDFLDSRLDRLHPKKSQRPLASGKISVRLIGGLMAGLVAGGLLICAEVSREVLAIALTFIALHLVYNFVTKRIVLWDVIFIAIGFQIRIWAGALATGIDPSVWLQLCVFLLALFLGFTKRRYEISSLREKAPEHRSVLAHYTAYLLDQIIIICSTLAIVFYGLYTISSEIAQRIGHQNMVYSVVFVMYGIFRYLYLVHVKKLGDEPGEILATDKPLLMNVLLWILYVGVLLYH